MATHRISVDIDEDEHKYLKMCCLKLGVSIKEFVLKSTIERVDLWEDKWMLEQWERDGTLKEIEVESNDPNRTVFEMRTENGITYYTQKTYSDVEKRAHGI